MWLQPKGCRAQAHWRRAYLFAAKYQPNTEQLYGKQGYTERSESQL